MTGKGNRRATLQRTKSEGTGTDIKTIFNTNATPTRSHFDHSSILTEDEGAKKPNFFIKFLRKLALPSKDELKKFNWRSVQAQFGLLDNFDDCQKDIYLVDSGDIDPVDCPYRIQSFLGDVPPNAVGWSGVPSEVNSLYSTATSERKLSLKRKKTLGIPIEHMGEEELLQLLEDLFHDIPNEEIAWAKIPPELEILLEEALNHKWKDTDFTPELPKINNLLRKKLNKQMKLADHKSEWEDYVSEEESIGSYEEVQIVDDPNDLDGLSEDNLSNEEANWSDIEDIAEDEQFKEDDPTFFADLEKLFSSKYRGDNEDDKEFIDVASDTSSLFGDIPLEDYDETKAAIEKIFKDLPEFIDVTLDKSVGGLFAASHFLNDDEDIEVTSDIEDLFGDESQEEIEIHSSQSSLYDTDSSEESDVEDINSKRKEILKLRARQRQAIAVSETLVDNDLDPTGGNKAVKVVPPLELTDLELKDFIHLRFLKQVGKPLSKVADTLTPLENDIECLVQIAADIRGYGKPVDTDERDPSEMDLAPKAEGPSYAFANVAPEEEEVVKNVDQDQRNSIPHHYSLEFNVPLNVNVQPIILNNEKNRFHEPKTLAEYKLKKASLEQLRKLKEKPTKSLKSRIWNCDIKAAQRFRHRFFHKTSLGKALRKHTRYHRQYVHFPKYCRRCKVPLEESLIPLTTPMSISFCCLLPILSAPCYYAHKEYRCFVCKEIYVLGDFKPPADITLEERKAKRHQNEKSKLK